MLFLRRVQNAANGRGGIVPRLLWPVKTLTIRIKASCALKNIPQSMYQEEMRVEARVKKGAEYGIQENP